MAKILICYFSKSGNTKQMAKFIAQGVKQENVEVMVKDVEETEPDEFLEYQGIILGSPTYYGACAAPIKELVDDSVKHHGKLEGRVGGAFTSSANLAGGNETVIMSLLQMLMIHGMVVKGDPHGSHYGPVSVGTPDARAEEECRAYGKSMAQLTKRLFD
jgi:NAD(P)H dehydrogenase (quinone)